MIRSDPSAAEPHRLNLAGMCLVVQIDYGVFYGVNERFLSNHDKILIIVVKTESGCDIFGADGQMNVFLQSHVCLFC